MSFHHLVTSIHVGLGLCILSISILVGAYASLTMVQHNQLRSKKLFGWLEKMPPLQTTERWLKRCVASLFVMVSALTAVSLWWYAEPVGHGPLTWLCLGISWAILGLVWWAMHKGLLNGLQASAWVIAAVSALLCV